MQDAFIFDAVRTPRGKGIASRDNKPGGGLSHLSPQVLVSQLSKALSDRSSSAAISQCTNLTLGCVGQVGSQGGHIALVSKVEAGLPEYVRPKTINNYCISGLTAVIETVSAIRSGGAGLSMAGGVEMLSQVPFLADKAAYYSDPQTMKNLEWVAPIMGAELLATLEGHTKADYDALTVRSHERANKAWQEGRYKSGVISIKNPDGSSALEHDEWVRSDLSFEDLAGLKPAFAAMGEAGQDAILLRHFPEISTVNRVHSIAHTPGLADGAALVLLGSKNDGENAGLKPMAKVIAVAEAAGNPVLQFDAGFSAMEQALEKVGMTLNDMDLIEFMEAFAAPPVRFEQNYEPDMEKVNVNGGHIAMGHPMGATGGILITTLVHELTRQKKQFGLVVGLAGGGLGAAMIIERV